MFLWLVCVLLIVIGLYLLGTWHHNRFNKFGLPHDKPLPFIGNMGPFILHKVSFADTFIQLYRKYKGSKMIGFYQCLTPWIVVCDPDIIKQITVKDFNYFTDHVAPIKEDDDVLFGKILFEMQGERWRQMRHTLSPAFTASKMKAMFLLITQCGKQLADYLEKKCEENGGLLTMNMKDFFTRYSNDVIATSAFGIHCDSLKHPTNEFYKMGKEATNLGGFQLLKFFGFLVNRKFMKFLNIKFVSSRVSKFFLSLVKDTMTARERENIIRPDMIHLLMEARKGTLKSVDPVEDLPTKSTNESVDDDVNKKIVWSDDDITAQAFLFFFAGFDTTSAHLCFLFHHLAEQPAIQKRVQQEIDAVLLEDGGQITYEGVQRLKYCDMVISEALRMWTPAFVTDRQCVRPYTIPATDTTPSIKLNVGDVVILPIIAIQRDPDNFPDPDRFDPERFSEENKGNIKPFTYIPFGVGPRNCIGMRFAQMETKVALVSILSRFCVEFNEKTAKSMILNKFTFNMGIEGGFWLGMRPRQQES